MQRLSKQHDSVRTSIALPQDIFDAVNVIVEGLGVKKSDFIRKAISVELAKAERVLAKRRKKK